MKCDEIQEQASQYIDGELGDADAGELFAHLGTCLQCRVFLRGSLELRSKIHDDILKTEASVTQKTKKLVGHQEHAIRFALDKNRLSLSFAAAIGFVTVIVVATLLASLALRTSDPGDNPEPKVVYLMSLPTVEVQGVYPVENQ